jgi:hypothetical protein
LEEVTGFELFKNLTISIDFRSDAKSTSVGIDQEKGKNTFDPKLVYFVDVVNLSGSKVHISKGVAELGKILSNFFESKARLVEVKLNYGSLSTALGEDENDLIVSSGDIRAYRIDFGI